MHWGQRAPNTKATRVFLESIPERCSAKTWYCSTLYTGAVKGWAHWKVVLNTHQQHPPRMQWPRELTAFPLLGSTSAGGGCEHMILLTPSNYFSSELHTEFPAELKQREENVLKGERGKISFPFWWPLCTAGMKHTLVHSSPEKMVNVLNSIHLLLEALSCKHFKCQHPSESKDYTYPLKPYPVVQSPHHWQGLGEFEIIRSSKGSRGPVWYSGLFLRETERLKQYLSWSVFPFPDVQ